MTPEPNAGTAIVLVTDNALRLGTLFAPVAIGAVISSAGARECPLDEAFSGAVDLVRALHGALQGEAHAFRDRLGDVPVEGHAIPLLSSDGAVVGTIVVARDPTNRADAETALEFLATHDPLTGLLNRHRLMAVLEEQPCHEEGVLVIFDIDRFAQINELAGHATGDDLLRAVAERIRHLEHAGHAVARLGSDEFACYLTASKSGEPLTDVVDALHDSLEAPFSAGHAEVVVRSTMGAARHPVDGSGEDLLQHASLALQTAKTTARGATVWYDASFDRKMSVRGRLERDLRNALRRGEFAMYYQPLIDAQNGGVIAAEALLRWQHPDLGLLTPDVFLSIAEESDAVVDIGRWGIDRACRDAILFRPTVGELRLNVNVSPRHVQSSKLVADVANTLEDTGWAAGSLQLEMTERILISDVPAAALTLERLRELGISIAIDDFGTGYNTLSYLKSYPVSCLKIDRAFVKDAESDSYSRAICRSVAALATSLELTVIGEGVETVEQADFLREIGCSELQGFHFGVPAPAWDFVAAYGGAA
jgi:diguanylate cyclase (GGDEF)-like protein